jgi:hypothetical protein
MFSSLNQIQISGLIALLVATPFLIKSVRNLYLANASKKWPKVSGAIHKISDFGSTKKFRLQYVYTLSKTAYKSNRIFFTNSNSAIKQRATEFEKKYTLHQIIDVFYNPKNPKQAVLEPGRKDGLLLAIIILSILFVFGCLAVFNPALLMQLIGPYFEII